MYILVGASASKSTKEADLSDSTISIKSSREASEREPLLPSKDCPSSMDSNDQVELPIAASEGTKVFLIIFIFTYGDLSS